jgi:hypothetical protein
MKRAVLTVVGVLLSAPSWAGGGGHFAPHMMSSPSETRQFAINRPHDIIVGPTSHAATTPNDIIVGPTSHGVGTETAYGPLVKPAWKD